MGKQESGITVFILPLGKGALLHAYYVPNTDDPQTSDRVPNPDTSLVWCRKLKAQR